MAELKHKSCGGVVSIDIARQFSLRTHSIVITPSEVQLGVLELNVSDKHAKPLLACNSCDAKFELDGDLSGITSFCLVCSRNKPVSEMYTSLHFPAICEDCKESMFGKNKKDKNRLVTEVLDLSLSTSVKFVSFVELLQKPIG